MAGGLDAQAHRTRRLTIAQQEAALQAGGLRRVGRPDASDRRQRLERIHDGKMAVKTKLLIPPVGVPTHGFPGRCEIAQGP